MCKTKTYTLPKTPLNNNIDDFMFIPEASSRWAIPENTLKARFKINIIPETSKAELIYLETLGYVKYFAKPDKRGSWLLTRQLMELWYGEEPVIDEIIYNDKIPNKE